MPKVKKYYKKEEKRKLFDLSVIEFLGNIKKRQDVNYSYPFLFTVMPEYDSRGERIRSRNLSSRPEGVYRYAERKRGKIVNKNLIKKEEKRKLFDLIINEFVQGKRRGTN